MTSASASTLQRMAVFNKPFKWEPLQNASSYRMNEFRKLNLYCDVVLDVDGKHFPCHRLILVAASRFFQAMFDGNFKESSSPIVVLKEIEPEVMEQILDITYTAQIHLTPEKVYSILKASHLLQFETIVDACVKCIRSNPQVHYLIEIYLFAKKMALHELYDICVEALADDLVHWGKTDIFLELQFEDFNLLLSKGNFTVIKDEVFLLILKWSKCNNANATNVRTLLQSAKLEGKMIGSAAMAQFIASGESELVNAFDRNAEDDYAGMNVDFCINLYMKTTEVKTGAKGWSVLQMNDSLDKYTLSSFYPSNRYVQRVCKIGTQLYCFEYDIIERKCIFSRYEDNKRTELNVPTGFTPDIFISYEMISLIPMRGSIYLTSNGNLSIWRYNYELDEWKLAFEQRVPNYSSREAMYDCPRCRFALTALDDVLYVIGSQIILGFDSRTPTTRKKIHQPFPYQHDNCAVSSFDGKIVLSGSNHGNVLHNTFTIFDVAANQFMPVKGMNIGRANHKLIHRGNFIYAIENSPFATNEMYDINSNSWTELPALPKRVLLKSTDGSTTLATGYVFDADSHSNAVVV